LKPASSPSIHLAYHGLIVLVSKRIWGSLPLAPAPHSYTACQVRHRRT
jgi:hypothetical protein